jgi:hypothetical protein
MGKLVERFFCSQPENGAELRHALSENDACFVLITCGRPSQDGQMKVELSYGGDPVLAAYLVESAQNLIDKEIKAT